jgi:hypothetical protein
MKRIWSTEELSEQWSVGSEDRAKLPDKQALGLDTEQRRALEAAAWLRGVLRLGHGRASGTAGRELDEGPSRPGDNLPLSLTSFVDCQPEIGEIIAPVRAHRLLTLTGAGGIGKSRTALQVATAIFDSVAGDVWLVDLAPISDASVAATIARARSPSPAKRLGARDAYSRGL